MANRYPLIFDTSTDKLRELPEGDNLNLTGCGIAGADAVQATTVNAVTINASNIVLNSVELADVATSGEYSDLNNAPTKISDLEQDLNYVSAGAAITNLDNNAGYLTEVDWDDVTNKPSTLQGYGIIDALTTGSPNSLLLNDAGYIKQSDLTNGTLEINHSGDVVGSVFAADSTILVDSILASINLAGTVRGDIIPKYNLVQDIGSPVEQFKKLYVEYIFTEHIQGPLTIDYQTGDPSAWDGSAPTTVTEALDRIAALLKALNGGTGA